MFGAGDIKMAACLIGCLGYGNFIKIFILASILAIVVNIFIKLGKDSCKSSDKI